MDHILPYPLSIKIINSIIRMQNTKKNIPFRKLLHLGIILLR